MTEPDDTAAPDDAEAATPRLPVLWLLGKTGAGKSSLVRALTGLDEIEIGSGFAPCTRSARAFDFPREAPLLRFLDTRGLGEAGYEAAEDLAACEARSHAVLAMARLDDPAQADLVAAIRDLRRRRPGLKVILLHTAAAEVPDPQARFRARAATQSALEAAARGPLPWVELSLAPGRESGTDALLDLLGEAMPDVALLLREGPGEAEAFRAARPLVLRYAGAAAAADAAPVIGAVGVPGLQAAMLRGLAQRRGVEWDRARMAEFAAALGLGAALRFGAGYVARQAAKLVPVAGQTLGAAIAGSASFAATYALGRAAHYWLWREATGDPASEAELRALYREALRGAKRG
ncbi:YcjF family protein [Limimaricola pyoseonensis]|uniref:50S ribosome-binding GTPase n=1 Tax=Limimaricola pyoseonensis TaxID=521013 RepID=A0A1G7I844_9RHOB|nr:GTPase [Limimaricola pyoseonensis]SDF08529.1 50S ribosome-binding GTPase [Limimaricola pyoseonensis]